MRVPRTIRFPFGYAVKVRLLTSAQMKAQGEQDSDGWWESSTRTIFVRKRLPAARLRFIIGHETQHAVLDWQVHCCNEGTMKP